MRERLVAFLVVAFQFLLRLYPRHFREDFGAEMITVFTQNVEDALERGGWKVAVVCLREVHDTPQVLVDAYQCVWKEEWRTGVETLREITTTADLPPPPPDGRASWLQTGLEISLFLIAGLLLLGITYLPWEAVGAGWSRDLGLLGKVITLLTLPVLLVGLARGLPRWAYPFAGLLLGAHALRADLASLWPFLGVMLVAYTILAGAALLAEQPPSPLPVVFRRVGQSLSLTWTRLSFGVYGAAPLAIIMAFDDGRVNYLTPYMALSVLAMIAGALLYCRSKQEGTQIGALAAGMSVAIWAGWLDKIDLAAQVGQRMALPYPGRGDLMWMVGLWATWAALLLVPAALRQIGRAVSLKSAT